MRFKSCRLFLYASIVGLTICANSNVIADVVASGLNTSVSGSVDYFVSDGTRPNNGPNLFHSFESFSISSDESVTFISDGIPGTENIISRVTGTSPSEIFGQINTQDFSNANFYFFNPNGIFFGENTVLNVSGSLHMATGNYLEFEQGSDFGIGTGTSLLTVEKPGSFGFIDDNNALISTMNSQIFVNSGDLAFTSPRIEINGGFLATGQGDIKLSSGNNNLTSGSISILNGLVTTLGNGDTIEISSNDFDISGANAGVVGCLYSCESTRVELDVSDSIDINGGAGIIANSSSTVFQDSAGIVIKGFQNLTLSEGGSISTASATVPIPGITPTISRNILIDSSTGRINITGANSRIDSSASGGGLAGKITIVGSLLTLKEQGLIQATSSGISDQQRSGDVILKLNEIFVGSGAQITNQSSGTGSEGAISIFDNQTLQITGAGSKIESRSFGSGNGGAISIITNNLEVSNGGLISSVSTVGASGNGGDIDVNVSRLIQLESGGEISTSVASGESNGGNINISGSSQNSLVLLNNGSQIIAKADAGNGGEITFNIQGVIQSPDSIISAEAGVAGTDGEVVFNTPDVNASSGVVQLPETFADQSDSLGSRCTNRTEEGSHFYVGTQDGLATSPDAFVASYNEGLDLAAETSTNSKSSGAGAAVIATIDCED